MNVLPDLSKLTMHTMPISVQKRKASDMTPGEIYFKAYTSGRYRKLSNLFGPVEWKYQQAKFKEGSEVYKFLQYGLQKTLNGSFEDEEFKVALKAMGHTGKWDSYKDSDNALATGLIAQLTSLIAKNLAANLGKSAQETFTVRKRLTYIMGLEKTITHADALKWHVENVNDPLEDEKADELMESLLVEKYAIPKYRDLLRQTGTNILHEAKGRGKPSKWEWQEKPLDQGQKDANFTRGGDVLGKLLMKVRGNIVEAPAPAQPSEEGVSNDDEQDAIDDEELWGKDDDVWSDFGTHVEAIGTKPDAAAAASLNYLGPQSARPMPRWYWRSPANPAMGFMTPSRWRKFDKDADPMAKEALFHAESETKSGPLKPQYYKSIGITVLTWDHTNRRGTFHWANKKVYEFERLSQKEAAAVQVDNFVYDATVVSQVATYLQTFPHAVEAFRRMMRKETELAKTHVFFYHSYGATALINDLGACIMRVVDPATFTDPETRNAILPRTDHSAFNNRSPASIIKNFASWYNVDGSPYFRAVGMSTVLNCLKPDTEATVSEYFKGNYAVGTNLQDPLDELLERFQLTALKDALLQMALEADFDVAPYFDTNPKFFSRTASKEHWKPLDYGLNSELKSAFYNFANDDNQLGPKVVTTTSGHKAMLSRLKPGAQARGTLVLPNMFKLDLLLNTVNTGNYLQLAVPHDAVHKIAYANVLIPTWGTPDSNPARALNKVKDLKVTVNGQARLIPRPDLMWGKAVKQTLFHFSRHAAATRESYLRDMEALIRDFMTNGLKVRAKRLLKPAPIVVRSHNTMWEAQKSANSKAGTPSNIPDLVKEHSVAEHSFLCLQECTSDLIKQLQAALKTSKPTHTLLQGKACGSKHAKSVMVYDAARFQLVGSPTYMCFELKDGSIDEGRPAMVALFDDKYLMDRRIAVASIHAPHSGSHPYSLYKNLKRFVDTALNGAKYDTLHHIIIAGDFNRQDWEKEREIWSLPASYSSYYNTPPRPKLVSVQKAKGLKSTIKALAYDNVLFSSRNFMHTLERKKFEVFGKFGSDHSVVEVVFRA